MNKEYAIYPFKHMNITQRHDQGNHAGHSIGVTNYSDLPWDEACEDGRRSYFEPQNDLIIEEVLGLGNNITNSVRLRSFNKLYIPYKNEPEYLYITLTHMNEDNLKQVKVGQVLKKGTKILMEGTDGNTTGNHFHITANIGKYYGFLQNNNGKWCYTYEKSLLPNEAFYLDPTYTKVIYNRNYSFATVPKEDTILGNPVIRNENINQIEVTKDGIYARSTPELDGNILGVIKSGIYNYKDVLEVNNYTWYYIETYWILYSNNWAILYPKIEVVEPQEEKSNSNISWFQKIFNIIVNFFRKIFKTSDK